MKSALNSGSPLDIRDLYYKFRLELDIQMKQANRVGIEVFSQTMTRSVHPDQQLDTRSEVILQLAFERTLNGKTNI